MLKLNLNIKEFPNKIIFKDTKLEISNPGIYLLKGKNGSGKSTLLKMIIGTEGFNGDLKLNDEILDKKNAKKYIEFIDQRNYFISVFNQNENENINKVINDEYNFKENKKIKSKTKNQLSLGERILSVIKSLKDLNKSIILLDEITSHLDKSNFNNVINKLIELSKDKIIIIATHDSRFNLYGLKKIHIKDNIIVFGDTSKESIKALKQNKISNKAHVFLFKKMFLNKVLLNLVISIFSGVVFSISLALFERNFYDVKSEFNSVLDNISTLIVEKVDNNEDFSLLEFEEYVNQYDLVEGKINEFDVTTSLNENVLIDPSNEANFIDGNKTLIPGTFINLPYTLKRNVNKIPLRFLKSIDSYEYLIETKFVVDEDLQSYYENTNSVKFSKKIIPFSRYLSDYLINVTRTLNLDEVVCNVENDYFTFIDKFDYDFKFNEVFKGEVKVVHDENLKDYEVIISDSAFLELVFKKGFLNTISITKTKNNINKIKDNLYKYAKDIFVRDSSNRNSTLSITEMITKNIPESIFAFVSLGSTSLILVIIIAILTLRYLINSRIKDYEIVLNKDFDKKKIMAFELAESSLFIVISIFIAYILNSLNWHLLMYKKVAIFAFNYKVFLVVICFALLIILLEYLYIKFCSFDSIKRRKTK